MSTLVCVSKCQTEWSNEGLGKKRRIPLACICTGAAGVKLCKAGCG
jgi:hypothetical protein